MNAVTNLIDSVALRRAPSGAAKTAILALTLLAWMLGPRPSLAEMDAGEFLTSFGQRAVSELNDTGLNETQREDRFRTLFNEAVDLPAIGRFILGVNWRSATKQERADFLSVFEDIALQRFLPVFTRQTDQYAGTGFEIVEVRESETRKGHFFVRALVEREQGEPARLVWRIRKRDDQYKILDVSAEGVSMVLMLREEYGSAINQTGSVAGLVDLMREKVRAGVFVPKPTQTQ